MRSWVNRISLLAAVCATVGLGACLPDNRDPDAAAGGSGQLSATFYGNGLGSVALSLQNIIVTQSDWFTNVHSGEVDMAALGVSNTGMGVGVKSFLCTMPGGAVRQLTWIDARDAHDKFALRGIGNDAGSIVGSLRDRVAGNQVGIYKGGSNVEMADGSTFSTASIGCPSTPPIPTGAPVLSFDIARPAAPSVAMGRTEFRTRPCGPDATGRQRRGVMVQSRTVTYAPDGSINPSDPNAGWTSDINSMGECMNDVVVQVTQREFHAGMGTVNMNNFAAIALRDLLQQQLQMDCSKSKVMKDMDDKKDANTMSEDRGAHKRVEKAIDTCPLAVNVTGRPQVEENDMGDATDRKTLACTGLTPEILREFPNLYGNGLRHTAWTAGSALLLRQVDNRTNTSAGQQGTRYHWVGTDINCTGYQTFFVDCGKIPGNPTTTQRVSGNKWDVRGIGGYRVHRNWLDGVFGICGFFGSCTKVTGGEVTILNPNYFTGLDQLQNHGTTSFRNMGAFNWLDNITFIPNAQPTTIWRISDNQCLWSERTMIQNCPFTYDPGQQGNWGMTHISAYNPRPAALDPGLSGDGSDSSDLYLDSRSKGELTASVVLHWKKCDIKGCKYWDEPYGPGQNAYIKSWNGVPPNNLITLTGNQVELRNQMCSDIDYQLNAYSIMQEKDVLKGNAQIVMNNRAYTRNQAQWQVDNAQYALNDLYEDYNNSMNAYYSYANDAATYAQWAQDSYNWAAAMENHNAYATDTCNGWTWIPDYWGNPYWNPWDLWFYPDYQPGYYACTGGWTPPTYYSQADINTAYANGYWYDQQSAIASQNATNAYWAAQAQIPSISTIEAAMVGLQNTLNQAQTQYNDAYDKYTVANNTYIRAKAVNDEHLQHPLTSEEISGLQQVQNQTCNSASGVLDEGSQTNYKQTCAQYYSSPGNYSTVPSLGTFCDATFDRVGETSLSFKENYTPMYGGDVQTTLLNTEGVDLAWRPVLEGNATPGATTYLVTRQRGFATPLNCARSEYEYIQWPVIQYYYQCGGKGGCRLNTRYTTMTITKSTAREWSGLSYETGTWSIPQTIYTTPWGNYGDINQIPNPMYTW